MPCIILLVSYIESQDIKAFRLKEMNNIRDLLHHMDAAGCL